MKNSLNEILDKCSAEELDVLLKNIDMPLPEEISVERICKSALRKSAAAPKRKFKKIVLLAACIAMLTGAITGVFVIAEAVEYDNAVKYCNENNIPVKGLSREDIKSVYRNITTETYYYSENTINLPEKNIFENRISGYNIQMNNYNEDYNKFFQNAENTGVYYDYDTAFSKYNHNKQIWSTNMTDFDIYGYLVLSDNKLLVYGGTYFRKSNFGCIAVLDDNNGEILWKKEIDNVFINTAVENKDGSITVFGSAYNYEDNNTRFIKIYTFDTDGEMISTYQIERSEPIHIMKVCTMENGWILRAVDSDGAKLLKINSNGELANTFSYQSDYEKYDFSDFMEFNGKMYISAVVRKERQYNEDMKELETLSESGEILDELREEFTSVLLVCDLDNGVPQEFYSVKGSIAGDLSTDGQGKLIWNVNRMISAELAETDLYSISGVQRKYTYTFNESELLESAEKTDILSRYYI